MKNLLYTTILILLTSLSACQRPSYPHTLQQAESVMNTRPDSALHLLQNMADTVSMLPEEAQMYYHLLTIQAKDKQYITHTSDSLINHIVEFYEDYGNKDRLMMAYYYQGSTYRDMNDAPRALKAFHQAIDTGKDTKNLTLLGQTYGQMGTLFSYQKLYDEAMDATHKALQYYKLTKDSVRFPYLFRDIARIHSAKMNIDSAFMYYQKAYDMASLQNNKRLINSSTGEVGCLLYDMGEIDKAKEYIIKALSANQQMPNAILKLGQIYEKEGKLDSARICWEKAALSTNLGIQSYAYFYLSQLPETTLTKSYDKRYDILKDSLNNIIQTESLEKFHLLYRFQRSEKENDTLILDSQRKQTQIYLLLLSLSSLLFFSLFIFFLYNRGKKEAKMQKKRLAILLEDNQRNMKEKELQIEILRTQIFGDKTSLLYTDNKSKEYALQNTDIYKLFTHIGNGITKKDVTNKDWEELKTAVHSFYPRFIQQICLLHPNITEQELKVCLLIKAKFSVKEISIILQCSAAAISLLRKRLHSKITGGEGSVKEFDRIISDLQ